MFFRLTIWNLKSTIRWWQFVLSIVVFAIIAMYCVMQLQSLSSTTNLNTTVWDSLVLAFSGPPIDGRVVDGLIWLLPQLLLFYIVGNFAKEELVSRGEYILPLIGSRFVWWIGKVIILALYSFVFFVTGFAVVFTVSGFLLPISSSWGELLLTKDYLPFLSKYSVSYIISIMFVLLYTTGLSMTLLQVVLSLIFNSVYAFFIVSALSIFTLISGSLYLKLVPFLPSNQAIISRHSLFDSSIIAFSIEWSIIYNFIVIGAAIVFGAWQIKTMDIFGIDV